MKCERYLKERIIRIFGFCLVCSKTSITVVIMCKYSGVMINAGDIKQRNCIKFMNIVGGELQRIVECTSK